MSKCSVLTAFSLIVLCVSGCLDDCGRGHTRPPVPSEPTLRCNGAADCDTFDASTGAACFFPRTNGTLAQVGVCSESCSAWSEQQVSMSTSLHEPVCLGINAQGSFDSSVSGSQSGRWMFLCTPPEVTMRGLVCRTVDYGSIQVSVYFANQ